MIATGCSGGDAKTVETTTTLFPATTTVVETTITAPSPVIEVEDAAPVLKYANHAIEFIPKEDSFSFENFGGGEAPADLTVNMARRLYGDDQVCSDVADNKCTPYPVILQLIQQANKSMQGGLCEGLAVLSLRLAGDLNTLASYQGTDTVAQLIKEDPALLSEIAYWYVTQFAVEVQQEASSFLEKSPKELAEVLLYDFAQAELGNPYTGFTIGIYSDHGGHAVTPYRVEQTEDGYKIFIYDSNWPNAERWIDVNDDGWVYALAATNPSEEASAWSGGVGTMELTPMKIRSGPFTCGFCPTEGSTKSGTLLTVAASGDKQMSLKIVTESGQRLGYYDEGFINEIPGATYRYLISSPSTSDPVLVFLPPEVESFSADVQEIDVPELEVSTEEVVEEEVKVQKFSLLLLNEDKSVQIEAVVQEEPEEIVEEVVVEEQSLIAFSEESIEIAEIEEATVAIAIDALEVEIDLERGQQIEVIFDVEQPAPDTGEVVTVQPQMMEISIADEVGEVLAEVEIDMSLYRVQESVEEPVTTVPNLPDATVPAPQPVVVPVIIEMSYDVEVGEIVQEEERIEAWVASDAEYFQAVADDNLAEVVGESWAEEIEEVVEWEPEVEGDFDLTAVILSVDEEYWEDDQWEEIDYDEEWFEERLEEEFFNEEFNFESVHAFIEEIEEEQEFVRLEIEEYEILEEFGVEEWNEDLMGPSPTETLDWEEEDWIAYDEEMEAFWEDQMEDPEAWEETLLEDMGLEEWDPMWGPSPTESADWTEDDWDTFDVEWATDEEARILEEEGFEEWPEDWGPSPSESALWVEEDWQAYDAEQEARWEEEEGSWEEESWELDTDEEWDEWQEEFWPEDAEWCDECEEGPWDDPEWDEPWNNDDWTAEDEEARILEGVGLEEWPEDWGPSPAQTWEWTEDDWMAYDEEMQAQLEDEWDDVTEEWTEEEWDDWDDFTGEEEEEWEWENEGTSEDDEFEVWPGWDNEEWSGDDEEAWILEQEGFDEWPEDWGPSPSESWEWTENDWQSYDEEQSALWEEEWYNEEYGESDEESDEDGNETGWGDDEPEREEEDEWLERPEEEVGDWDNWSGEDEEAWILEQEGWEEWPEDWGPSPSESWDWTEEDWQAYDEEFEPDSTPFEQEEVVEEQVDETEMPDAEEGPGYEEERDGWTGEDEEGWILEQEGLDEWPDDWGPPPSESWDWEEEDWQAYDAEHGVPPPPEPVPEPEPEESWDPYDGCRGTSACESAPGGYDDWEDYDAANNPAYYDDWGTPPGGYVTWVDFTIEVEAGIVDSDVAEEYLPEEVQEAYIPVVVPVAVYYPTITYTNTNIALSETISTSTVTAQTGTATTTSESGILTHNSNDGHWHLDTTTATIVTTTHVDTTTVVARTGSDMTTCTLSDGVQQSCSTVRGWSPQATTVTAGDAYTSASTTTATVATEEGCSEGGWRGMGDWCIVQSSSRQDRDHIQFSLTEVTSVRIDAETNLTRAQFDTSNEAADPYLYLSQDNNSADGNHSGDTSAVTVGIQVESDDDGGSDCGSTCTNPPSSAVDVDETPTITYCDTGGACSDGVPVIDNVSDQWDSRIVRTNMPVGDYVVQASVYNTANSGWYRLTIEEDE